MKLPALHPDFEDLLTCFVAERVQFIVVGAFAVAAHGVVRATGDLDVWVRADAVNAARVWRALQRFGAPLQQHRLSASDFAVPGGVYQMGLPPMRIDVLTRIDAVTFDDAWPDRLVSDVAGLRLSFLGLKALVRNKRAAGRPKDLQDLLLLAEAGVDVGTE